MLRCTRYAFALAIAVALLAPVSATATPMHLAGPTGGAQDASLTIGFEFIVGPDPVSITALGIMEQGPLGSYGFGSSAEREAAIWETDGTPVASVLVNQLTDPLVDGFIWGSLPAPVVLQANTSYILGARTDNAFYAFLPLANDILDPAFTLVQGRWVSGGPTYVIPTAQFPSGTDASFYWTHVNAQFTVVPEPVGLMLVAAALVALGVHRRR